MADFYTVLLNSLKQRDIWDPAAREGVYVQARLAMIKRLWGYKPPLSTAQIEERILSFDTAVQRIEQEVGIALARQAPRPAERSGREAQPTPDQGDSYRQQDFHAPALYDRGRPEPDYGRGRQYVEPARTERRTDWDGPQPSQQLLPAPKANRYAVDDRVEDDDYDEGDEDDWEDEPPEPRLRQTAPARADGGRRLDRDQVRSMLGRSVARLNPVRGGARAYSERDLIPPSPARRYVALGVFATAALVFGFIAYVFFPILTPRVSDAAIEPPQAAGGATTRAFTATNATPPTGAKGQLDTDRVPVTNAARGAAATITLFDGANPTVFSSSADNPIRAASDAFGGYVRISTTSSSTGARATIGPGLVQRLAGHTVRVTVQVRSATEAGAASVRFAYQATGTASPWKIAQLSTGYSGAEFTWQVPPSGAGTVHVIQIEPGVPGDRTAADIKSITIDVIGP